MSLRPHPPSNEREGSSTTTKLALDHSWLMQVKAMAKMGSWLLNPATGGMTWSAELCQILGIGFDAGPRTQSRFLEFLHPDDRHLFTLTLARSAKDHQDAFTEIRLILASGVQKIVDQHVHIDFDDAGNATRVVGIFQDVTERRKIENELRQQRSQLALAGRLGKLGAWRLDIPSPHVWWSEEVCAIHDVPAGTAPTLAEAIGFYLPRCRELISTACLACMEQGVPFDLELEISTGKGQHRWVRAIGEAVRDTSNSTVAIHGAFQDITERKTSEERNARLEARLVSTFESLDMGFFAVDLEWRITYVNSHMERHAGVSREKLLGAPLWSSIPGILGTPFEALLRAAMEGRTSVSTEAYFAPFSAWCAATAHGSGEVLAVYVRDMSAQHHAQQLFEQSAASLEARVLERTGELDQARREAELASSAKTVFLTTMSHEIRTPMNGVIGLIDVLRRTQLLPDQSEIVNLLNASAKSLMTIIDNILDFSKIEAKRMELELRPLRLSEEVEQVCAILHPSAAGKDVELYVFVDPAIPELLMGDETRIHQVLLNLIGNAIKFSGGRGKSGHVSVRALCTQSTPQDATVSIEVSDNGIGMEPETLNCLFTAFQQADVSTTRRFGGTGLGLTITHSLVAMMGGEIEVRSAPGVGSVFQLRLKLERCGVESTAKVEKDVLQGITCEIVGSLGSLATDLAIYLSDAGATIGSLPANSDRPHVVVILPGQSVSSIRAARASGTTVANARTRFVVLAIDKSASPEVGATGCVEMDVRAMSRTNLYRAVALAAGNAPKPPVSRRVAVTKFRPQRGGVILVAEDNAMNREVIARQLRLLSYAADFASDGKQALDLWRLHEYAVLLTDLRMPEMDGCALAAAIRAAEPPGKRLPIIALSATTLAEEVSRCRAIGIDDFLSKPLLLETLRKALEKWVPADAGVKARAPLPVDLAVLRSMIGESEEDTASMLKLFRSGSRELRSEIKHSAISDDGARAASAAHRLKSNAYAIGAKVLGDLCALIEHAGTTPGSADLNDLVRAMEVEATKVNAYLDSLASAREGVSAS